MEYLSLLYNENCKRYILDKTSDKILMNFLPIYNNVSCIIPRHLFFANIHYRTVPEETNFTKSFLNTCDRKLDIILILMID